MKKSYYLKNGNYYDVTTQREYTPKGYCELCGNHNQLTVHHFLPQNKCINDLNSKKVIYPNTWNQNFINKYQQLFTLCLQCHSDIHTMDKASFKRKHYVDKKDYIYNK